MVILLQQITNQIKSIMNISIFEYMRTQNKVKVIVSLSNLTYNFLKLHFFDIVFLQRLISP